MPAERREMGQAPLFGPAGDRLRVDAEQLGDFRGSQDALRRNGHTSIVAHNGWYRHVLDAARGVLRGVVPSGAVIAYYSGADGDGQRWPLAARQ